MTAVNRRVDRDIVKKFLAFWKPSLASRLTISFTLFGLVIGYLVLIFTIFSATDSFIQMATQTIRHRMKSLSSAGDENRGFEILKFLEMSRMDLAGAEKNLQGFFSHVKYSVFYIDGGLWHRLSIDASGKVQSQIIVDPVMNAELEKVRGDRILTSSKLFFIKQDKVNVKIDVTRPDDKRKYLLSFDVYPINIFKILRENLSRGAIFFIGLLFISRTLGYLFSIRLARPIEQLAREAAEIANGQYEKRFTTGRTDEIGMLADALNHMASCILDGTREREKLLIGILISLTRSIDAKSPWTAGHSERVTRMAEAIGSYLQLNDDQMRILKISAILHDIGKIAVPEQILDKPGRLTEEEFNLIKKHPQTGADILSSIPSYETILPGILYHHERWDGAGYPTGTGGKDIPLMARIICVADVYDALTADRPYRKAWSREETLRYFEEQKGILFDPHLVEILKEIGPCPADGQVSRMLF
ncbi:MAG TPA: HD domain-containing phosphohydrolase [Smithellaceae bacterium]|nr:HD domain-containing phosphohydrolase [Smithellaceae bacterium]HQM46583.1 HD domain-containing phosphohydrolase [Smithellaceae bacterium]